MSIDLAHDPRSALVRTKYFSLRPKPLERWLWKQNLPPTAERVFWLHWEAGMQNGDWCSEIPLKRVALECCINPSTVTRAYQILKTLQLIRREDPGRDPSNPFQQATAITEVRLPRELLSELSRSPNRPGKAQKSAYEASEKQRSEAAAAPAGAPARPQASREENQAMWSRASAAERTRFFVASRDRVTHLEFEATTRLTAEDRGNILAQLSQVAAARPALSAQNPASPMRIPNGPRRLSVLEMARTRHQVLDLVPALSAQEVLRQVLWAVEEGALQRFAISMAVNIALKKIREGAWSRPHRMPPNWMPRALQKAVAQPETCSVA